MLHSVDQYSNTRHNLLRRDTLASLSSSRQSSSLRTIAGAMLLGALASLFVPTVHAQAAPQVLPYINTIVAGSGATYTPATVKGSTTTPVHGSSTGDGGPATSAPLASPTHIAIDSLGDIYFTDNSGPVRKVDTQGNITTFAGGLKVGSTTGLCPVSTTSILGDGCPANEAYLNSPYGIAIDPANGDIYVAESANNSYRVRKINHATYTISTIVNVGGVKNTLSGTANGDLATCAAPQTCSGTPGLLSAPRGLAVDKHGNLYIMDEANSAVRLANFTTGQLTTVVNANPVTNQPTGLKATTTAVTGTCFTDGTTVTTAGAASIGVASAIVFDNNDNLYIADATCNYVFKVAENPSTHMVDTGSAFSVVLGAGPGAPAQTTYTSQLGTSVSITPGGLVVDAQGNLYVGENTGNHVWFWDHTTGYMHTVYGGGTPGSCFGVASSGTSPYNGCDGFDADITPATAAGIPGLALDAWGNLYITDPKDFVVHKLSRGTNAPVATTPAGNANVLLHFGANDGYASISLTQAPDFSFAQQTCTVNSSTNTPAGDSTQDCGFILTNATTSASAQYERATVTSTTGKTTNISLTNQAYPTCQPVAGSNQTITIQSSTPILLSSQPGDACSGVEKLALAPHKYTYAVASGPLHGVLSGTALALTYVPNTGYTGGDSFTFSVTDTSTFTNSTIAYDGGAASATMETPSTQAGISGTITLQAYVPPVATPQSVAVTYNTAQSITLSGTDSNGATLAYTVATNPAHGTLSGTAPVLTYTPASNYFGTDSFTFTVNDGTSSSTAGTISITINPPPPTPGNPSATVPFQTATQITLTATGSGTITYAIATQPTHGTLGTLTGASVTYTPTGTYSGADSFTYTASNAGGSTVGTVSITVSAAPINVVAQNSSATVINATPTAITAVAGGGNGNPLIYTVVAGPTHGTLGAFTGSSITYTPTGTYSGPDNFTFKATDGTSTSSTATVSITVTLAPPVASGQSVTTAFATALPITTVATGPGTLTYSVVTAPAHGTLTGTLPNVTYTPGSNYAGADSFIFKANNGADSNPATVSINVTAPPAPTASNASITVPNATATTAPVSATGLGTITYAVTVSPVHGTLSGTAPNYLYTPTGTYSGPDSFIYTATNPGGTSSPATVTINVLPVPPVAQAQSVSVPFNTPTPIVLVATGSGTLTYTLVTMPLNGTLTGTPPSLTYTPAAAFTGSDSFTFKANNGADSPTVKVSITVLPAPPVAASQSVTVSYNTAQAITLVATGSGSRTYQIVTQPAGGTLIGTAQNLTYTPNLNFAGTDSFTFTATNSGGVSNIATVSITVNGAFTWTVAPGGSFSATATRGQTVAYNLLLGGYTGASGQVNFTCTGSPVPCTVNPNPATLNGTAAIPVTVSVTTVPAQPGTAGLWFIGSGKAGRWMILFNLGWLALIIPLARKRRMLCRVAIAFLAMTIIAGATGCGGNIPEQPFGTAPGLYTVTVTATAGVVTTGQTLTLTVN